MGGKASYSLYLCHLIALDAVAATAGHAEVALLLYVAKVGLALALSACFYLLVEKPAHGLARRAS